MRTLALARASIRRLLRDRVALFFMIVLPIGIILIVGVTVGGYTKFKVGVVDLGAGSAGAQLTAALQRSGDLTVVTYPTPSSLGRAIAREEISTGVILPAGMTSARQAGNPVQIGVVAERSNSTQQAASTAVRAVVAAQGAKVQAAAFAAGSVPGSFDSDLSLAQSLAASASSVHVDTRVADSSLNFLPQGFSYSAPTMLVLFVFINSVARGSWIVETRRLGMYERMSVAPLRARTIVAGEAISFALMALLQAVLIVGVGAIFFGVSWGNPLASAALVVVWVLVGTGAGLLAGTVFSTPEQATAIGPVAGLTLGMLGGCMWPLAIVSPIMRTIGHFTPQAWAVDSWTVLLSQGGTLGDIAPKLGVLLAFAGVLTAVAIGRMRTIVGSASLRHRPPESTGSALPADSREPSARVGS